ncbi:MAG: hypothetical protein L6R40_008763 [Gallowayella cf. fulva]|nr:MAG: hypothetical protein L6R40_008763 [Xanthomendoza cf. fulva]
MSLVLEDNMNLELRVSGKRVIMDGNPVNIDIRKLPYIRMFNIPEIFDHFLEIRSHNELRGQKRVFSDIKEGAVEEPAEKKIKTKG